MWNIRSLLQPLNSAVNAKAVTDNKTLTNEHGGVSVKLYLQKQVVALIGSIGCCLLTHLVHFIAWNEFWILSTIAESKGCIFKFTCNVPYIIFKNIPWNKLDNSPGLRKEIPRIEKHVA